MRLYCRVLSDKHYLFKSPITNIIGRMNQYLINKQDDTSWRILTLQSGVAMCVDFQRD